MSHHSSGNAKRIPAIGIDVGGTGIKGAGVDPATGERLTKRHRVETPQGGAPDAIAAAVAAMVAGIRDELAERELLDRTLVPKIGVTLPGVVQRGIMRTAANIDKRWIDTDAEALLTAAVGAPCLVVNDADAAGMAETEFGAARGQHGVTMVLTFGTGIGTALIHDGRLVPNFELGHLQLNGQLDYERFASPKNIEREGITIADWAARVAPYLAHLEFVCRPDLFVIGGSISKSSDEYLPFEHVTTPVVPAHFRNNAGIVGAAALAAAAG
ncbi:ROK family protein [Leucobacter sp. CSA1]|uniref:ROK family protein n=1 Tax=Leucobacter chromiisoli TaxID=2796471 RepID=A0A934Q7G9_9MICO|nr:ROK family protein [Leucobacter chromiisoli]MBK0419669.1 ROK family protein [Leucobacter chromiisoli]